MPPSGFAVLIGAGPTSGAGIARVLANPSQGNMAVALLARNKDNLTQLCEGLRQTSDGGRTFTEISQHAAFRDLKLKVAVFHVKHALKRPFLATTPDEFERNVAAYTTGAFSFAQEALKLMYAQNGGETSLAENPAKKGTIIFTGTLGAMRTNAEFNAYGAGRSAVRMIAQGLGKEHSGKRVHVVHTIANGGIQDVSKDENEDVRVGKKMSAESVGKTYLWLSQLEPDLWIDELDMRPAQEKW
ncbi:Uu.00g135810.m01.CDS01 [Anthostomella pinea]|uniref:Uu.00g135810.m01.CDS01 n=1 Tax=Anthostomella pinea TaxID=933095 RepID=A0AAI8VP98_9PEZI|nr:Uu.00g135810.m01.CDS01 [Anthostomella pinea]